MRSRAVADSTRPKELPGPYGDGPSTWRVRRAYASGDGSRASWHAYGYSAGKSACSRENSTTFGGMVKSAHLRYALEAPGVKSPACHWYTRPNGIGSLINAPRARATRRGAMMTMR